MRARLVVDVPGRLQKTKTICVRSMSDTASFAITDSVDVTILSPNSVILNLNIE